MPRARGPFDVPQMNWSKKILNARLLQYMTGSWVAEVKLGACSAKAFRDRQHPSGQRPENGQSITGPISVDFQCRVSGHSAYIQTSVLSLRSRWTFSLYWDQCTFSVESLDIQTILRQVYFQCGVSGHSAYLKISELSVQSQWTFSLYWDQCTFSAESVDIQTISRPVYFQCGVSGYSDYIKTSVHSVQSQWTFRLYQGQCTFIAESVDIQPTLRPV